MSLALPNIAKILENYLTKYAQDKDLIHNVRIGREGLSYASYNLAKKLDIPFVFTPVHHPRWVGWRYREYIKLYQLADAVITLTNSEREILIKLGVKENKIHLTGHGPILAPNSHPEAFKKRYQIDAPMVLFLGQHYPYKGYQQLLQATAAIWQKVPETKFVFIGPPVGNSEQIYAQYRDTRIIRLGSVDLQTKTDALAACSVLCVPSTQESFGGVYTEAWSFAKPVIGCDIPAVAEVISHVVDGFLIPQEPEYIAKIICQVLLDNNLAASLGLAGQKKVQEKFTWERLAEKTEKIYRDAIDSKSCN
jgi:glycosyltransferase involved in cell wall biosynthesis